MIVIWTNEISDVKHALYGNSDQFKIEDFAYQVHISYRKKKYILNTYIHVFKGLEKTPKHLYYLKSKYVYCISYLKKDPNVNCNILQPKPHLKFSSFIHRENSLTKLENSGTIFGKRFDEKQIENVLSLAVLQFVVFNIVPTSLWRSTLTIAPIETK